MGTLSGLTKEQLRAALDEVDGKKPTQRLMIALAYVDGESVSTLSDRYGIPASTIYYWLDRFDERPLEQALVDDDRPGRPRKLNADERAALEADLQSPPDAFGFDDAHWTPEVLREHVEQQYDVTYSLGHVRRLLREELRSIDSHYLL